MTTFYKCNYFKIYELVDPLVFNSWGDKAWSFFKPEALMTLDAFREFYGVTVTINSWYWKGQFSNRGLRSPQSLVGATFSQHRFGNAFDLDVKGVPASKVREDILKYKNDVFPHITRLEDTLNGEPINWVHFDCANVAERIVLLHV